MASSVSVSVLLGRLKFLLNACVGLLVIAYVLSFTAPPGLSGSSLLVIVFSAGAVVLWYESRRVLDEIFTAAYRQSPSLLRRPSLQRLKGSTLTKVTIFVVAGIFAFHGLFGLVVDISARIGGGISGLGPALLVIMSSFASTFLTAAAIFGIIYLVFAQRSLKSAILELEMVDFVQDAPVPRRRERHVSAYEPQPHPELQSAPPARTEVRAAPEPAVALKAQPQPEERPRAETRPFPEVRVDLKRIAELGRNDVLNFMIQKYRTQGGVHAETIIGATAALAADFALRGTARELPVGHNWVVSEGADRLLYAGEEQGEATVWSIIRGGALKAGADPAALPDLETTVKRVADAVGSSPFPPLSIPAEHYPHEWSPNAGPKLRDELAGITARAGLTTEQTALALGFALARLMEYTSDVLAPELSATLALEIMAGVARMSPLSREIE